ncbi:MAG TPA: lysine--tRNA ligase [Magnetospirillum sp.]|jgi:lysyl-tRNA synthetase class 1|nr:lysine--tRNA ligase [Magnetospirillum sp.]
MSDLSDLARNATAWPFQEAKALLDERLKGKTPDKGFVLFETGYGPSGLPHIGTFGEVARTTMVRNALKVLAPELPSKLFAFSDDMDGLRKVPDNIPNQDIVRPHLGKPLTQVPDPFGTHDSFGAHNNARLRAFLDAFGFEYEFQSATEWYKAGKFDAAKLRILECYDEVINVILPTLGDERRATYSPFLPVCPETGIVLQVPVVEKDVKAGTIVYKRDDSKLVETPVTGAHCKMQWKADWAMRWYALGVDYEMSGKDLIPSVELSSRICRILGGRPPMNLTYELFLDDKGQKISKSKGNGLAVEDWLKYAPDASLALFMYQKPKAAKRLYFDVIPRSVDDYLTYLGKFESEDAAKRLDNPAWHIHNGTPPKEEAHLSFSILLNLASVCNSDDKAVLWGFIKRYAPGASPETAPILDKLVEGAVAYYQDFVKPAKQYRAATPEEVQAFTDLKAKLGAMGADASAEELQNAVYEIGKRDAFPELKAWFKACYEVLLGQDQGPRMGSFIKLYGVENTIALLDKAIKGEAMA